MLNDYTPSFVVALVFFASGIVKGVLGMGLPTVAIGLLGLVMSVSAAAALLTLPSLVTNIWQACVGPGLAATLRRLWPMQVGILAATIAAPMLSDIRDESTGRLLLGACLVLYGAFGLLGWRVPPTPARLERGAGLLTGLLTGVITAITGVFVLPAVPFLHSLQLTKSALAQALGVSFTTSTVALAASLALTGHLNAGMSLASLLMVAPALAGMWVGQMVRGSLSELQFRRFFFAGLLLLGVWLLLR